MVTFSFEWTAPASFTSVTLNAWGNSVNLNFSTTGDSAASDSLEVFSSDADSPTPSASPTPTPTPLTGGCSDLEPLKPYLVGDPAARECQEAIAKAGRVYLKKDLKAVQKCLKAMHKGSLTGDPALVCVGDASTLPTDPSTNLKLSGAQAKASAAIAAACTDASVAPLRLCAATLGGLQTCLTAAHRQRVGDAVASEYGTVAPNVDAGVRACQNAIAGAARKFLVAAASAGQKCLNARNQDCMIGNAAASCLGSVVAGTYVPPSDAKTAEKVATAEAKLRAKILAKCTDAQVAALDGCGTDSATAADCTVCTHRQ
jgi:hypothetical protein